MMRPEAGGSWFVLTIDRPDKSHVLLHQDELSAIALAEISALTSKMMRDGLRPVANDSGGWMTIDLDQDLCPYTVPPSVRELARYMPSGTVITLDNGCLPSIEWRFGQAGVEVFDVSDY
jgi:hypothetical protein